MKAKMIMVQGTASNVGKSIFVTALCRIFYRMGFATTPFKSQNMSLNSFATSDGKEIGMAQAVQAEAACVPVTTDMNPILLKPTSNTGSQVIIKGDPIGTMSARDYMAQKNRFLSTIQESLAALANQFDVVIIEGAGSPVEINLKDSDIVNMRIAKLADSPVILVSDIDRGGVFASLIGTLELLDKDEKERIKGFIINKFRGDRSLLDSGITMIEERTGIPVLGVLPFFSDITIRDEDSLSLTSKTTRIATNIHVCVIKLPKISNFTDFEPFKQEPDVALTYVTNSHDLAHADLIIIPGSKNTIQDMLYLQENGFTKALNDCKNDNIPIIGICGGYQMLGKIIKDPEGIESEQRTIKGLGFLDIETIIKPTKTTEQVTAQFVPTSIKESVIAYEIHMGETTVNQVNCTPAFTLTMRGEKKVLISEGATSKTHPIWGSYLHGLFDNNSFRTDLLNNLRRKKGKNEKEEVSINRNNEYDKLAEIVLKHIDIDYIKQKIMKIAGQS